MKSLFVPAAVIALTTGQSVAQSIIGSGAFFAPEFEVFRDEEGQELVDLSVTNVPVSNSSANATTNWVHSAGGHARIRAEVEQNAPVAEVDVQLSAYTRTANDSLVFGRRITTAVEPLDGPVDVRAEEEALVEQVAQAGVVYNWSSTSTVSGLVIAPEQLYEVRFEVTSGAGLPTDFLDSAFFGISTEGIVGAGNVSARSLNLLNIGTIGTNSSTGLFSFFFSSDRLLSSLDFEFAASTGTEVEYLGGTARNQNVLTFSGFEVAAVPEPASLGLCASFAGMLTLRRFRKARHAFDT